MLLTMVSKLRLPSFESALCRPAREIPGFLTGSRRSGAKRRKVPRYVGFSLAGMAATWMGYAL